MKTIYANWEEDLVKLTWKPEMTLNNSIKVTSVHSVCIKDNKVLLCLIEGRGFNIPGGHIDADETFEEALHRETKEEAYVLGELSYLGCLEISHEENPNFNPNGKYPKIAYQMFYRMDVLECLPFLREYEATTRIWVEPSEIAYVINDHELILDIINVAFAKGSSNIK